MKKFVLIIVLFLAAAGAALPWINGMVMEKMVRNAMDQVNQMYAETGTQIRVDIVAYNRGYAHSRIEWKVDLGNYEPAYGVRDVLFTETASHGLIGITSETSLEKNPWFANWVAGPLNGKNPLTIQTRYSAFSPITTRASLAAFTLETGKKPLKIGAMEMAVTMDKAFEHVSAKGKWEGLSEDDENRLGPVLFESEQEKVSGLVWQGHAQVTMEDLAAREPKGLLDLTHLVFTADVTADKDASQMDVAMAAVVDDITLNGTSLSGWALGLGFNKMDIQAYEELYRLYGKMVGEIAPLLSDPNLLPQERDRVLGAAMVQNQAGMVAGFEKLLKKGFEIQISQVDITLPQGRIQGHLSLGLLKDMTLAGFFPVAARPELALEIFSLDSEISLPGPFLSMQPHLIAPVFPGMKTGLFVPKDDRLLHQSQTRDKVLYMNGEVVDLTQAY